MVNREELVEVMRREGALAYPREACGVVVAVGKRSEVITCRNAAPNDLQFMIHHDDHVAALKRGEIIAVWHTHPNMTPEPSEADLAGVETTAVPWFILGVRKGDGGFVFEGPSVTEPTGFAMPYIERPYVDGVFDCYSLVRDYYRREFGAILGDYPRVLSDGTRGNVAFADHYEAEGFVRAEGEARVGDVFLIQTGGAVPTHVAIYIGNDQILHHCHGRLSRRDVYGGYWLKHTTHHLRLKEKC